MPNTVQDESRIAETYFVAVRKLKAVREVKEKLKEVRINSIYSVLRT